MLLDIGGIVINVNNLVSFKVEKKRRTYCLKIFMLDGTLYNVSYDNPEHLLRDINFIQEATKL